MELAMTGGNKSNVNWGGGISKIHIFKPANMPYLLDNSTYGEEVA